MGAEDQLAISVRSVYFADLPHCRPLFSGLNQTARIKLAVFL